MKRLYLKKINKRNTIMRIFVVFFCALIIAIFLFNFYTHKTSTKSIILVNSKIDTILYQFFNELITDDIINKENINDLLTITKNNYGEILTVNYDLEKTYKILTKVANILKKGVDDLENGLIDVNNYDQYLESGHHGLIFNIPLFLYELYII